MTTERRRYFRIDDQALVKYRVIDARALPRERELIQLNEIRATNLQAALQGLDTRLQALLDQATHEHPAIGQALELINRKLSLIEDVVALESARGGHHTGSDHQPRALSLSGGGLALIADDAMGLGTLLVVDLILLPAHHPMRTIGRVVDCRAAASGGHTVAIEFEEIRRSRPADRSHRAARRRTAARATGRSPARGLTAFRPSAG